MEVNIPVEKPWGSELLLYLGEHYALKHLIMNKGQRCSLQKHTKKEETIYVLFGMLQIELKEGRVIKLLKGSFITLKPGTLHRMSAPLGKVEYLECSTPELDDVIRLEDDYGRE